MPVSREQAEKWESEASAVAAHVSYFAEERTRPWEFRLKEYWTRQQKESTPWEECVRRCMRQSLNTRIGKEFHGFMDLPQEIRNMIYRYLLVKGSVFPPNYGCSDVVGKRILTYNNKGTHDASGDTYLRYEGLGQHRLSRHKDPGQSIGLLLGVSKAIQYEAACVYFRFNRFVFPCGECDSQLFRCVYGIGGEYESIYRCMRDVSYTFDMRDVSTSSSLMFNARYDQPMRPGEDDD
ncbi:uncharacterized protein F4822DRAFT_405711 [Hypoxylon trugodes]|uniref:uncharacterized protein n=1 Tax=Hypoxylon trugodes TaxID=326681 RepID=UPI00219F1492|nr:uncharacterized protein F4822DRAFT_405711 [Hypoxylon trugodes]KAI1387191.1 hypothetical protein F4822DRAFT_405711 [Hypoxylon trugodes]